MEGGRPPTVADLVDEWAGRAGRLTAERDNLRKALKKHETALKEEKQCTILWRKAAEEAEEDRDEAQRVLEGRCPSCGSADPETLRGQCSPGMPQYEGIDPWHQFSEQLGGVEAEEKGERGRGEIAKCIPLQDEANAERAADRPEPCRRCGEVSCVERGDAEAELAEIWEKAEEAEELWYRARQALAAYDDRGDYEESVRALRALVTTQPQLFPDPPQQQSKNQPQEGLGELLEWCEEVRALSENAAADASSRRSHHAAAYFDGREDICKQVAYRIRQLRGGEG